MPRITRIPFDANAKIITDWLNVIVTFKPRYEYKYQYVNPADFVRASDQGFIDFLPDEPPRIIFQKYDSNNRPRDLFTVRREGHVRLIKYTVDSDIRNINALGHADWHDPAVHIIDGQAHRRSQGECNRVVEVNRMKLK